MTHHTSDYLTLLRDRGFRVTPQRQMILDAICESGGHTTPEEIYERVHAKAPAVNLATVYRTVTFLSELRLITEMHVSGKTYYEIAGEAPHHHLVCRKCGHTEQIDHATIAELFERIALEQQFKVETDHLALVGLCKHCQPGQN
ncbi:MAG: Fur family transcriptional regulator [Caldilineaceae bacterium]